MNVHQIADVLLCPFALHQIERLFHHPAVYSINSRITFLVCLPYHILSSSWELSLRVLHCSYRIGREPVQRTSREIRVKTLTLVDSSLFLPAAKPTGLVEADCSSFFSRSSKNSVVCGPIWLILWYMVKVGHVYLATRWRPNRPPGGATRVQPEMTEIFFIASECSWASIKRKSFRILKIEWAKPELYIP